MFASFLIFFTIGCSAFANPLIGTWEGPMHYEDSDEDTGDGNLRIVLSQQADQISFQQLTSDAKSAWSNNEIFDFKLREAELFQDSKKVGQMDNTVLKVQNVIDPCQDDEDIFSVELSIKPNGSLHYEADGKGSCPGGYYAYRISGNLEKVH